jgi:hypothetical protein
LPQKFIPGKSDREAFGNRAVAFEKPEVWETAGLVLLEEFLTFCGFIFQPRLCPSRDPALLSLTLASA